MWPEENADSFQLDSQDVDNVASSGEEAKNSSANVSDSEMVGQSGVINAARASEIAGPVEVAEAVDPAEPVETARAVDAVEEFNDVDMEDGANAEHGIGDANDNDRRGVTQYSFFITKEDVENGRASVGIELRFPRSNNSSVSVPPQPCSTGNSLTRYRPAPELSALEMPILTSVHKKH